MIKHELQYLEHIQACGVGRNDQVASSPASYVSYLRSVSDLIKHDITPETLRCETDISNIEAKLNGVRAPKTIKNYCSAMRQYIAFVQENRL